MLVQDIIWLLTPVSVIIGMIFSYSHFMRAKKLEQEKLDEFNTTVKIKLDSLQKDMTFLRADHDEFIIIKEKVSNIEKSINKNNCGV